MRMPGFVSLGLAVVLMCGNLGATAITSTTFNGWKAALTGAPSEADFSTVSFSNYNTSAGITLSTIGDASTRFTFTGPDNGGYQLSGTTYNGFTALASAANTNAGINVAMPGSGKNAIFLVFGSTGGTTLSLTLSDGESFSLSSGMFGISISHPITSLYLSTAASSQTVIDDFWFGSSSLTQDSSGSGNAGDTTPTSEGATILLVSGGALILIGAKRRLGVTVRA